MDPNAIDDGFERQVFDYVVPFAVAASAVQTPFTLTIYSDADFEWWWASLSRTSNLLQLLITEQATNRSLIGTNVATTGFNGIFVDNWAGTTQGGAMFPLAVPYVMPAPTSGWPGSKPAAKNIAG